MDAGGLAQMNHSNFASPSAFGMPSSTGLASRRGGQNIKPLALSSTAEVKDNGAPTPRTSRSHLLAGLRTAPKSATAATFPASPTSAMPPAHGLPRGNAGYGSAHDMYGGPKTALPRYGQQQQTFQSGMGSQFYTPEQVLAPPEIRIDEPGAEQMDPNLYAQLVATNLYLAQQQQRLQQQLMSVQAAAQQFQGLNLTGAQQQQLQQQQLAMYQQQQQIKNLQQSMMGSAMAAQSQGVYAYYDPSTGQQAYYVDPNAAQLNSAFAEQAQLAQAYANAHQQQLQQQQFQLQQQAQQLAQHAMAAPRVQVSPPPESHIRGVRTTSPPRRFESPSEHTPLPPPSANAFRRGHKKASSLANNNQLLVGTQDTPLKSAGPKTASFPLTPLTGGYGPGQGRAGEHPVRQPRGPPSFDELKSKPTAKHEGSRNFSARTRRSAVHNLVRAGRERSMGTSSSSGSMSPLSESAEESATPITDNESDSGRSGSGSLSGDLECSFPSSRISAAGAWGAIGSDRPGSRQKTRKGVSSATSCCESDNNTNTNTSTDTSSFADVFKNSAQRAAAQAEATDGQRKAPMLVLTSVEKRKAGPVLA